MKLSGLVLGCVFLLFGCGVEYPDRQALIEELYTAKVAEIRDQRRQDCLKGQVEKAKSEVDSIVHQLLNKDLLDTLNFPAKPIKPVRPEDIIGTVQQPDAG